MLLPVFPPPQAENVVPRDNKQRKAITYSNRPRCLRDRLVESSARPDNPDQANHSASLSVVLGKTGWVSIAEGPTVVTATVTDVGVEP